MSETGAAGLRAGLRRRHMTMLAFGGTEIVTIAAAESREPGHAVARATGNVLWRVALFYVLSILLVVAIPPPGPRSWPRSCRRTRCSRS